METWGHPPESGLPVTEQLGCPETGACAGRWAGARHSGAWDCVEGLDALTGQEAEVRTAGATPGIAALSTGKLEEKQGNRKLSACGAHGRPAAAPASASSDQVRQEELTALKTPKMPPTRQ